MKTKNIIQRLCLFLFALVLAAPTWAQGTEVVSISSAADWKTFCQRVNDNGEPFLNAKLTQDVDLGGEIVMLGSVSYPYSGTFDGQGHTLKFNWNAGEDNQIAPFYYVENATIKNLRTQGKITSKGNGLSGMVYAALGTTTISGCISDVDITGGNGGWNDSRAAGMVQAVAYGASVQITDCLVKGSITDNADEDDRAMAGFVLSNSGTYTLTRCLYVGKNNAANSKYSKTFGTEKDISATFTDCYYLNTCGKAQGKQVTAERLKSGEMAKLLQGDRTENVWGQTLGTDLEPLPTADAKHVYKVAFTYNGKEVASRYANRGGNVGTLPTPQEILGVAYNTANTYRLVFADGFYAEYPIYADCTVAVDVIVNNMCEIATKEDWKKFGYFVISGERNLNAKLTVDLNLGTDIQKIGSESTDYRGTFDGQGHTITIDWNGNGGDYFALFPFVTDATIKNLRVTGKMTTDVPMGVFSYLAGGNTTFSGCVSDVKITNGDKNDTYCAAGMVREAYSEGKITFKDCIVAGDLNGTTDNSRQNMGGFVCGQADDATCTFNNCLYTGTNNAKGGYTFAPTPTLNNCYYVNAFANVQGTPTTAEQLASGYVAWMLQSGRAENVWGQTLGTDNEPQLSATAKHVYKVAFTYNGKEVASRYANRGGNVGTLPTPQEILGVAYNTANTYKLVFADGFYAEYPIYADRTVAVDVIVNNMCEIATKEDWKKFGDFVRSGERNLNARLTTDIDLGGDILKIGSESTGYSGTFDGQGHTITIDWNGNGGGYIALFPFVTNATIKNLRVTGKMTSDSEPLGVFSLEAGGNTTFSGCVSDVKITNGDKNDTYCATGMVLSADHDAKITFNDCIVAGDINGTVDNSQQNMGGFVSAQADDATCTFNNCLYTGTNNAKGGYAFAPKPTLNNCYYVNAFANVQGTPTTAEQLASGYVAWMLQSGRAENVWGQTLGTDKEPLLSADAAKHVYEVKFTYNNKVAATRYANSGKTIAGGMPSLTAKDLLGTGYNPHHYYTIAFAGSFNGSTTVDADRTVTVTLTEKDCYEIASKEDWKAFHDLVNNGQPAVDAKMTKDVNLETDITMAGTANKPYAGTFDGQGHTLKFNWNAGENNKIAPFRCVKDATIKNLRTQGKITTKGYGLSGMVCTAFGTTTITGCISDVDITGGNRGWNDSRAAGMVQAVGYQASVHITDCLVKGSITDNADESERYMAGFVFYNDGTYTLTRCLYVGTNNTPNNGYSYTFGTDDNGATFTDCYYLNPCGKAQGEQVTAERLKSGEMAKLLQGDRTDNVWGQTLGTDATPLPTDKADKRVCKVEFTYDNKVAAVRYANRGGHVTLPTPQEILGVAYNTANTYKLVFADGFYAEYPIHADRTVAVDVIVNNMCEIATKEDWKKFGELVRSGEGNLNAKLTVDLNLGTDIQKIGSESTGYSGTFDGQGHTITIDWNAHGAATYVALFPFVTNATIKNLRVTGQMTSDSKPLSVFSLEASGTTTYEHCISDVKITSGNKSSSNCAAGMVLSADHDAKITFKDCIVSGDLNGTTDNSQQNMGGFVCGQADDATCTFDNCLYTGTNNAKGGYAFAPKPTLNNCYYVNAFANVQGTPTTAEQLASGYVAWMLQSGRAENVWGQTLGTDNEPQLSAKADKRIYRVQFTHNGQVKTASYANSGKTVSLPDLAEFISEGYNPHHYYALAFGDGFTPTTPVDRDCSVPVTVTEKDYYEIASAADWKTFCNLINSAEQPSVDTKLKNDIDLGTEINMVGMRGIAYTGTFDGQGHTITIDWNAHGTDTYVALFPFVTNATIKNLRVTGKMTSDSQPLSVFSLAARGTTTYEHCISDVKITSGNTNSSYCAAGMVLSAHPESKITFNDCIVAGDINGTVDNSQQNMGGFVSAQADDATCTFNNCLYTGTNNAKGGYAFAPKPTLNNCYYVNAFANVQGTPTTAEQLASGYVAWMLQSGRAENVWGQTLGTDATPLPTDKADKRVCKVEFTYDNKVAAVRYANRGGNVTLPTAKDILGPAYDAAKTYALTFGGGFSETTVINSDEQVQAYINGTTTGIDGVTHDATDTRGAVYNLQGVRVAESSDAETLRRLPAGVYVVRGKKFVVR